MSEAAKQKSEDNKGLSQVSFSENPKEWFKRFFKEWILTLGIAFLVAFFFRTTIASPRHIPTGSMIPTIRIGEFIFVKMFEYDWHIPFTRQSFSKIKDPERGDIVVFEYPLDSSKDYIKRVVALPGDTIEIRDKQVILNGKTLERTPIEDESVLEEMRAKYRNIPLRLYEEKNGEATYTIMEMPSSIRPSRDVSPMTVPADSYFVMGDNRDDSQDSRYWGFVPREKVLGTGSFIWFSFDKEHFPFIRPARFFTLLD